MSDEHKAKGNVAFQQKDYPTAIKHFTDGIAVDPKNHVLFSNRSACYASLNDFDKALEDAKTCVDLKSDWAKGYSRLGAAFHGLGKFDDAIAAYKTGLEKDPGMAALQSGLAAAEQAKSNPGHPLGKIFNPQTLLMVMQSNDPKIVALKNDQEFMQILLKICQDSSQIGNYLNDPRIMTLLQVLLGGGGAEDDVPPPPKKRAKSPEPVKELTPEEIEAKKIHEQAEEQKLIGTKHYKAKEFEEAIAAYKKASEIEPKNIIYLNNIAAVYLEQKDYEKCREQCDLAVEKGREFNSDFKDIAKAMARKATSYQKEEKYDEAIAQYKTALLEHRSADTLSKLNACEAEKKKKEEASYFSVEKSEEARLLGNEAFSQKHDYPAAVAHYTEAIKRNPKAHALYSNRAAAFMKLGAYDDAEKDCKTCLDLEPTFVKAVVRLAHIYFFRKEFHKALQEYDQGLKLDPSNEECKNGKLRTLEKIQESARADQGTDEERTQRAMADPEIRSILADTYMQQVLRELGENPSNFKHYQNSPKVMANINKLIAAGIIKTA